MTVDSIGCGLDGCGTQVAVDMTWLWTSSRCVPQVTAECRFGVSTFIGVESFGSNWWSPLFRIFQVESFFTPIINGGVFSLPVLEL